jgi:hypothetical protein
MAGRVIDQGGSTFRDTCDLLEDALTGPLRRAVIDQATSGRSLTDALGLLRRSMQTHTFRCPAGRLLLQDTIRRCDERTRRDGFHVLQEWDGARFIDDIIPVLMVDFHTREQVGAAADPRHCGILLDYYFLYVLALLLMRAWDDGEPGRNLDRVTGLLGDLQGPAGSGFAFVDDAETLLWIAISHYEPDDAAYDRLLDRVKLLDERHQVRIARIGAAVLGDHLRWGLPVYYEQDLGLMRADNVSDYPWLFFTVDVLLRAWSRMRESGVTGRERDDVVEALLSGLTPDPRALLDVPPPPALAEVGDELARFRELFQRCRDDLVREFEPHRPAQDGFSPLAFHFNFPHNVLIPMVTLALSRQADDRLNVSFNSLLTRVRPASQSPEFLARTLMAYAGFHPERRGRRATMMITFDPGAALLSYNRLLAVIGAFDTG